MSEYEGPSSAAISELLAGDGEMSALMRVRDWSSSPLGTPESWPEALRLALSICLHSSFPTAIYWGPELRLFYNDAWAPIPAERHPWALGRAAAEVWEDIWDVVGPQLAQVVQTGEGFSTYDQMLPMMRAGRAQETYWNYSFTPIRDADGAVVGVFNQGHETTDRVLAERRQAIRLALEERLREATEPRAVMAAAVEALGRHLGASRVGYSEVQSDGETIRCEACYADGVAPLIGTFRLADFGPESVDRQRRGATDVSDDLLADPAQVHATWEAIGTRAFVSVPLVRDGRLTASLYVNFPEVHHWTAEEVALIEDVAGRTWAAVERARAEAALAESEQRFRAFVTASSDAVYRMSADWTEMRQLAGRGFLADAEEPSRAWADSYLHPDDEPRVMTAIEDAIRTKSVFELEHRVRRADGTLGWTLSRAVPLLDADGEIVEWFGAATDVTERREFEERLRRSEVQLAEERTMLATLVEHLPVGVIVVGANGEPVLSNPAYRRIVPEGMIPSRLADSTQRWTGYDGEGRLIPPSEFPGARALRGETVRSAEFLHRAVTGEETWTRISGTPLRNAGGEVYGALCVVVDIDAQKRVEEALRQLTETLEQRVAERSAELEAAQEALRQSQKLEAMGQLTGGVAHDFNNLLTPIIASLDLLQRRSLGDERVQRLVDGALQSADRAKTLVQRLLAFARRQPLQTTSVDLSNLVEGMADLVDSTSGPRVKVVVDLAPNLPAVRADPNQLEMAILNLAVNARDAMPNGGALTIAASKKAVGVSERFELRPGGYVRLSVADTGTGMDAETLARAVEPFFSTKGIGQGTGLGLSMVHGLASQLGGALAIQSKPGLGTSVDLWLPVAEEAAPQAPGAGEAAELSAVGTALLVDDEALVRASTADMLAELGYAVVEAASAEEALRQLDGGLVPDIVVTDHLMPGMTGADLARTLKARRPDARVLIVSGYADDIGVAADLPRLTKPFRQVELAASLAALTGPADG